MAEMMAKQAIERSPAVTNLQTKLERMSQ